MRAARSRHGAAVVMAFDEQGQADTQARKVEICTRLPDSDRKLSGLRRKT